MSRKRTGILGGTFDPIHIGHLILAEQAREEYSLDNVILIPSCISYLKADSEVLPAFHRLNMTKLAAENNPFFTVSDIEIRRGGNSYTWETITELAESMPDTDLYYITGADTLFCMDKWVMPEKIFSACHILVSIRDGATEPEILKRAEEYSAKYTSDISLLKTTDIDISSHMIRSLAHEGKSVRYYVTDKVNNYIMENNLYK